MQARVRTEQLLVRLRAHPGAHMCVCLCFPAGSLCL